jgi:hypothetical protein
MKKLVLLASAAALFATPALAQSWEDRTYGDGLAGYDINADVVEFCKFGNVNNAGNANVGTVTGGASNGGIDIANGDATFDIDIQDDADNTVQTATGAFNFGYAQCNTAFTVTGTSQNGGLLSSETTSDADFTNNVPYSIAFAFDGIASGNRSVVGQAGVPISLINSNEARAGAARFAFRVEDSDRLLLAGEYTDYVRITLSPSTGA